MFLSKLSLNPRDRQVRCEIARPYEMHKTIWNRFPTLRRDPVSGEFLDRVLFRIDAARNGAEPFVIVQSDLEPDWTTLPDGYLRQAPECKPYNLAVVEHQPLRFRLRANPTKKVASKNERLGGVMVGKRVGLVTETEQIGWLVRKATAGGFQLRQVMPYPERSDPVYGCNSRLQGWVRDRKKFKDSDRVDTLTYVAVLFEGVLEVTDPILFRQTIAAGIGSAKAFGFGLLSVAPVSAGG